MRSEPTCATLDREISGWLAGDLDPALHLELAGHVESCVRCREMVGGSGALQAFIRELRAAPLHASPARSWSLVAAELARESARRPAPRALEALALLATGLLVAALLLAGNDAVMNAVEGSLPAWLAALFDGESRLRPFFLPLAFALFGACASAVALPLLGGGSFRLAPPPSRRAAVIAAGP